MSRRRLVRGTLLLALAGTAGAQSDFDVSMRVVDDVRGLNAVVIVIGDDAVETRSEPAAREATPPAGNAAAPDQ